MGKYVEVQISNLIEENRKEIAEAFLKAKTVPKEPARAQAKEIQTVQKTLGGYSVSVIPKVRTTDGHLMEWNRNTIVNQLIKETKLGEQFLLKPAITEEEAKDIAKEAEKRIKDMGVKFLSGPLVRELVNIILLERGHTEWRNISTRVGTPVFDAYKIDMGTGFEANDNANLQENAETSHKKKADKMSKEQYLLMLPPKLADAHLNGDIHIHDLEYLGTRAFCLDSTATIPMMNNGEFSFAKAGDFDGMFKKPEKIEDRELVDVSFLDIKFFGPRGCRKLLRVYRKKTDEKILALRTNLGKTLRLSKDHPLIVCENDNLLERRAGDTKTGTALATGTPLLFGTIPTKINLVRELCSKATAEEIENVYARGLGTFFEQNQAIVSAHGQLQKQWRTRGILPISRLAEMTADWSDEECEEGFVGVTIGVIGSEHVLPAIFEMTSEMARLTGYFVSEGNYNVTQGQNYNLVITNGNPEVIEDAKRGIQKLDTYATLSTQPNGAQQIYFGGKLAYLLFRRVLGIPEGAAGKRIPAKFFCMDKKISDEFLSAYLTGDGAFAYRKEKSDALISFTTQSEGLKTDLLYLLAANGIAARAYTTSSSKTFSTGHGHISNVWRVAFNGENVRRFLKFSTFLDERRSKAAAEFLDKVEPKKAAFKEERVAQMQEVDATTGYLYDFVLEGNENEEHVFMAGDGLLVHNCQDWDLRYFFYYGLMPDGSGTKASVAGPAKKAEVAILHAVKALGSAQTNFAGGQGFYNFLTFIAPYFEGMSYDEIEQLMQMFVYEMTQMMVARGGQLVFSSVQLSPGIPKLWRDKPVVYKGRVWNGEQAALRTYGEFEREVRLGFEALMNVMMKGDYWGKPFNFPKPEISIEPDFMIEDEEFNRKHPEILSYDELYTKAFELAAKYGAPYFDNQLPEYRGAGNGISCYQCLAGDELVPVVEKDGKMQVMSIERLFKNASKNGISVDLNGVEFARFDGRTPATDFETFTASLETFKGVMRKKYTGKLLNIILNTGRRIKVTPDHPVFVLENGTFVKKQAGEVETGQFMPVLKNIDFNKPQRRRDTERESLNAPLCLGAYVASTSQTGSAGYGYEMQKFFEEADYGECAAMTDLNRGQIFQSEHGLRGLDGFSRIRAHPRNPCDPCSITPPDTNQGDVHPLEIKKIEEEEYEGYVYDLVDVSNAHNFSNALGVITGNCCAYNFSSSHDKDDEFEQKLYFKDGKHFSMGAWQVVSINCPRAAYRAHKNDDALFRELKLLMDQSIELFRVKKKWMDIIIRNNRMPFATQRPKDPITMGRGEIAVGLSGLVYTIGVVGINEMVQYHTGKQFYESDEARRLAIRAMFELKFYAKELSQKYGMEIALARTPAETTAQRFAVSDLLHDEFRKSAEPLIKGNVPEALSRIRETRDLPIYYTNGTHVPPSAEVSLPQRIKLEETFFPIVDGGNILHIWLGEAAPDPHGLKEFAMNIAKNTQVGYFAFTKDMTVCMDDFHVASGLLKECPNCESENVEHLSRVTGYIQAVSGWNEGKKQELKDRKRYGVGGM